MIARLTAASGADLELIGGKGAGLVRLLAAELDVPEAWVVPAPVSLDSEARATCLKEALPDWWAEATAEFPGSQWAVRSSAVAEDLADASFAGVYETVMGIDSVDALAAAVEECWSALDTDRAEAYRSQQATERSGIALILQRMIRADVAGVMLTENPLRPFDDEIVIDASWGLGEAVVSGRTDPDHLVLDRESGEVLTERIGAKEIELHPTGIGGVAEREVPAERRAVRCLEERDLKALHTLEHDVTAAIGARRDIEWAIEGGHLYVLQDRPITGLPPREPKEVWTRRFGDEYLADYVSPLGNDLMIPWIIGPQMDEVAELQGRRRIVEMSKLRRHNGYIYLNGDYAIELARAVPLADREGPLTAWFDSTWADKVRTAKFEPKLLLRTLRAPRKDKGRGPITVNPGAMDQHCERIENEVVPLMDQDFAALTHEEWQRQLDLIHELGRNHFRVIRWGMAQHAPIIHALLAKLLRSWAPEEPADTFQRLISGLPGTRTAEINQDLYDLGASVRQEPGLLEALRSDASYDEVRDATADSAFWAGFDGFLATHGHRSSSREISAERWAEQPSLVLSLVRAQVAAVEAGTSPAEFEHEAATRRVDAEQRVLAAAGRGLSGRLRKRVLTKVLRLSQEYTVYRENQRYHLDYLLSHVHQLLLEQGRRLVARGALPHEQDIFLLTGDRLESLLATSGPVDDPELAAYVEDARAHWALHGNKLPATFLFDEVPTEGRIPPVGDLPEGALPGLAASAGLVEGPTRVVPTLADLSAVRPGEILVASNIDPGWTSVFPIIAGLITETGGVLSHGAILAREYGIPTVTCLPDALRALPTGTTVEVDGTRGFVRVVSEPS
ncbi:PEP/pyruvate-binding domain-containing protein [Nocardioides sp. Root140]|uniref:PEP/pyruvate-binding domain-containing protein n=1 Tax=Nocardioides sp. Root140 TaxID=1736460 RepID=UPI0006F7A563|nr:PEP/pyruvate-binding domain-containing protein [Nocardioides sp. Root140]KQY57109.1 hypothetical protein ASD30_12705 [Nocardioides sp. Root140]